MWPAVQLMSEPTSAKLKGLQGLRAAWRRPVVQRAVHDGLTLVGLAVLVLLVIWSPGSDAHAYWNFTPAQPYSGLEGDSGVFMYSPVAALASLPFHLMPFNVFRLLMIAVDMACLIYLTGSWALAMLALYPVTLDVSAGNIHLLLAVAIVLGFRYPALWAILVLTKVTPGVGLLWFAVRREWRSLAVALGVTGALALGSLIVEPGWWRTWIATLAASNNCSGTCPVGPVLLPIPVPPRLVAAALIVTWGAWTNRRWTVPVAAMLALPVVWWMSLPMLLAIVPLERTPEARAALLGRWRTRSPSSRPSDEALHPRQAG
jgi:Glycosyltransferase family 87